MGRDKATLLKAFVKMIRQLRVHTAQSVFGFVRSFTEACLNSERERRRRNKQFPM